MAYSAYSQAEQALRNLTTAIGTGAGGMDTSYFDPESRNFNPYGFQTDQGVIQSIYDAATNAAYAQQAKEAQQAANVAESNNYSNTKNAISELRRNMIGSASSGANVGATNATALQALLGLGQTNSALTTGALQNVQNIQGQKAAALAENAKSALTQAEAGKSSQANVATSKYQSEAERANYAAQAIGTLASAMDTNKTSTQMNDATNAANITIAKTPQVQKVYSGKTRGRG